MKCSSCGAEIANTSKFCEYCGTQITAEMQKEQERLNKAGCPKCGSSNITFDRETQGEVKGKNGTSIVRSTVGMCKDCGNTWYTEGNGPVKKRRTWLWVLGWICIFPVPLTILMLRPTSSLDKKLRYIIIAIAWIAYIGIAYGGEDESTSSSTDENTSAIETTDIGPSSAAGMKSAILLENDDIESKVNAEGKSIVTFGSLTIDGFTLLVK